MTEEEKSWINETWEKIDRKLSRAAVRSRNIIPYLSDENGRHIDQAGKDICWWTNGFWSGLMWLLYADTHKEAYQETALAAERILDGAFRVYDGLHHDVGFMWHISSGVNWRMNGDNGSRVRALYAANILAGRFNIKGGYITAWPGPDKRGWTIIDTMMNLPLLYWAAEESRDDRYKAIAVAHAGMAMRDHVREDGRICHIVVHDPDSGEVLEVLGGQGADSQSCWSRGSAWAIYGFVLSYIHTGREEYLHTAKRAANYLIAACAGDWRVRADLAAPREPVVYDSTAACCAACGLLEIAKCVRENERYIYFNAAWNLLKAVDRYFCNYDEAADYVVGYGTARYPRDGTAANVHVPMIYGDYFYVEALYKLRGNQMLFW